MPATSPEAIAFKRANGVLATKRKHALDHARRQPGFAPLCERARARCAAFTDIEVFDLTIAVALEHEAEILARVPKALGYVSPKPPRRRYRPQSR